MTRTRSRIGFRREVAIVLPLTILVLVVLSVFNAFAHRQGVERLAEARRAEARRSARVAAEALARGPQPTSAGLARLLSGAVSGSLISPEGRTLLSAGRPIEGRPLAPLGGVMPTEALALGPDEGSPGRILAFASLARDERLLVVRLDLEVPGLAGQLSTSRLLARITVVVGLAASLFMLVFLRYLLAPYDKLLSRARSLSRATDGAAEEGDEIAFLVESFERAVGSSERRSEEEDLAGVGRALVASLGSGLLLVDRAGLLLAFNPRAEELLGVGEPDVGNEIDEVLEHHPALAATIVSAAGGSDPVLRRELDLRGADGPRTLGVSVHPLKRDDGEVRGHIVLFADLTASHRRQVEQRLTDGLAHLGGMAAGIAHELRNGLATVRGYLALIERRPTEEAVTDYLTELKRESDHLERVLDDFLTFARPESRRIEPVDIEDLLRRAAADPALGPGPVTIVVPPQGLSPLSADPQLLERALRNLLLNAVQAQADRPGAGPVEASATQEPGGVTLKIADRGGGVPAALRENLFQPFATGRPDGVGLGLALSHRIATLHGGQLRLEDRPGGGTVAILSLPSDQNGTFGNSRLETHTSEETARAVDAPAKQGGS